MSSELEQPFKLKEYIPNNNILCGHCKSIVTLTNFGDGSTGKYYRCNNCDKLYHESRVVKEEVKVQPLGKIGGRFGKLTFKIVSSATSRSLNRDKDRDIFDPSQYPLAGKLDTDLVVLSSMGIITSLNIQDNSQSE